MLKLIKEKNGQRQFIADTETSEVIEVEPSQVEPARASVQALFKEIKESKVAKSRKPKIMKNGKPWSRKFDSCQECGTTEKKHASGGLCHTCFWRKRNKKKTKKRKRLSVISGLKTRGLTKYRCNSCEDIFSSTLPKIDIACPNCQSVNINETL